mmetsp:Transcript_25648/g.24504  ORF Transcript_25648/g.24504 Transcript_25648/m.24504 type:complete len:415 (+) Transcript_25648:117-1361(+)
MSASNTDQRFDLSSLELEFKVDVANDKNKDMIKKYNGNDRNDDGALSNCNMRNNEDAKCVVNAGQKCSNISNGNGEKKNTLFDRIVLNDLIFQELEGYLIYPSTDVNNLLNACRSFEIIKKAKYYWKLNKKYSAEYYHSTTFKHGIEALLNDARKQLSLRLTKRTPDAYSDLNKITDEVSNINSKIIDVSTLGNIHALNLSDNDAITDVSALGNVQVLNLDGCTSILDFSPLRTVKKLNLSNCHRIIDVSQLGAVFSLNLSCCWHVIDVSALGSVYELNLSDCSSIVDVSALGHVKILDVSGCNRITDVSSLSKVHHLNLSGCSGITDISALGRVHTLNLTRCYNIRDVSSLGHVHDLNLTSCRGITNVCNLGTVHTLNLSSCTDILDISTLDGVKELYLTKCRGKIDFNVGVI